MAAKHCNEFITKEHILSEGWLLQDCAQETMTEVQVRINAPCLAGTQMDKDSKKTKSNEQAYPQGTELKALQKISTLY